MRSQVVMFLCLTALAAAPAAAQQAPQRMYKCVDTKGKTYYTQIPPTECLGRDTQEMNKAGMLKKTERPVPPAEVQAREAERMTERPTAVWNDRFRAAAYALAGRKEEARRTLAGFARMYPDVTIALVRGGLPHTNRFLDRVAEGLEIAGMRP